jgi:protein MpaA
VLIGVAILTGLHHAPHDRDAAATISAQRGPRRLRHNVVLGYSVRRRPIVAYELGDPSSRRKAVIVGCIHGDEAAGVAVVRALARRTPIRGVDLWLVPTINPDGQAVDTRQNAHGVDLNRNFPWHWQPLGPRGTQQYAGPHPLSEPESRIARALIARLRPQVTIWFHQPLGVVDESGGSLAVERRFARLARLPLRRLTRYPGSAASWQNHRIPHSTAFVVELPPETPSRVEVERWSAAVRRTATANLR